MGNVRKHVMKSIRKQFRETARPLMESALHTGLRNIRSELSQSSADNSATSGVLLGNIAAAFYNGITAAGKELLNGGLDYIRSTAPDAAYAADETTGISDDMPTAASASDLDSNADLDSDSDSGSDSDSDSDSAEPES